MKQYNISYERNNVPQTILVEAVSAEIAERYFKHKKPDAKFYGIHEATADDMRPGKPVMLAKPFEVWKDCELGQTYCEETFFTKAEAYEWINKMERHYPGWHLRVVEVKDTEPSLDDVIKTCEKASKNGDERTRQEINTDKAR